MAARKKRKDKSVKARNQKSQPSKDRDTLIFKHLLIIIAVGIVFRIIYNIGLSGSLLFDKYILDSLVLHSWALDILNGSTPDRAFFRAPLYPYVLATTFKLFGVSQWSAVIMQNLLGLATAVVTYLFARRLVASTTTALWAGLVTVVYPTLIYFEGEVMITALAVFLYTLAAYRMFLAVATPSVRNLALAGIVFGLAAITRPTILPLGIVFPAAYIVRYGWSSLKPAVSRTVVLGLFALLPILPVTFANVVKGGEFVLISTQGGVNFYIGNANGADGITVVAPGPNLRIGKYSDNIWTSSVDEAERRTGEDLSQSEVSNFWFGQAMDTILANPVRTAGLYAKKIYYFFHGQEIFNNKSLYYAGEYSGLMRVLLWQGGLNFPSGLLFPLMVVGLVMAFRERKPFFIPGAFIGVFALVMSAFFVCSRFRQPIVPLAIIVAVYGVAALVRAYRESRGRLVTGIGVFVVLVIGLNLGGNIESGQNRSQFNMTLGSIYLREKQPELALPYLQEAVDLAPVNMGAYDPLGQTYFQLGMTEQAEQVYRAAHEKFPSYPLFNFGLGRVAQEQGDYAAAKDYYQRTLYNAEDFGPALDRMGRIYYNEGKLDSALIYYQRLLRLEPGNTRLREHVERIRQQIEGR